MTKGKLFVLLLVLAAPSLALAETCGLRPAPEMAMAGQLAALGVGLAGYLYMRHRRRA